MTKKTEFRIARRNWTREQQKTRIFELFRIRYQHGNFKPMTAQEIANNLEVIDASYIKDICLDMCEDELLWQQKVVHRTRKDGTQIIKSLFNVTCADEWIDLHMDTLAEAMQTKFNW